MVGQHRALVEMLCSLTEEQLLARAVALLGLDAPQEEDYLGLWLSIMQEAG